MRGVWSYRWWVAGLALVAAVVAYGYASTLPKRYTAVSLAQVISGPQQAGTYIDQNALLQLTNYYLVQAQTTPVAAAAASAVGPGTTTLDITHHVSVSSIPDGQELRFAATSGDPHQAAAYANAYADAYSSMVAARQSAGRQAALTSLQTQISGVETQLAHTRRATTANALSAQLAALQTQAAAVASRPQDVINVIQHAAAPSSPSSPKPAEDAAIVLVLALLLAIGGAYGLAMLNDRYRSAEEVSRELDLPLLGEIPQAPISEPAAIESFQSLRTALEFATQQVGGTYVVTSAQRAAGKTHVAVNLAGALAAGERSVALVDGDLRCPTVHERLGLYRQPGLGDALARPLEAIGLTGSNGKAGGSDGEGQPSGFLDVVTAGAPLADPGTALASASAARIIGGLRESHDIVLIDSPPATLADASLLARHSDGVILVVDARRDRRSSVRRAVQRLKGLDLAIVGVVFNGSRTAQMPYGYDSVPEPRMGASVSASLSRVLGVARRAGSVVADGWGPAAPAEGAEAVGGESAPSTRPEPGAEGAEPTEPGAAAASGSAPNGDQQESGLVSAG